MEHDELGDLKIALHYESTGRIRSSDMTNVKNDFEYMCNRYFDHPNYYRINGRPVVFVYITRKLEQLGVMESAVLTMRSTASKCGHDVYIVGDHVFENAPDPQTVFTPFWYFDAVTNYDLYGSMGRPSPYAGPDGVNRYYDQQEDWKDRANESGCRYIPATSPGYNDRGVRLQNDHPPLSRRLTANDAEGTLFWAQLERAKLLVDANVDNLIMVNSFNEWHEDTQIEPTAVSSSTTLPNLMTSGVSYEGYGDLYLNILRASTLEQGNPFGNLPNGI